MGTTGRGLLLGAVALCLLSAASPSAPAAERVAVSDGYVFDGPFLVGNRVAWAEQTCDPSEDAPCYSLEDGSEYNGFLERLRIAAPRRQPITLTKRPTQEVGGGGGGSSTRIYYYSQFSPGWRLDQRTADEDSESFRAPFNRYLAVGPTYGSAKQLLYRCSFPEDQDGTGTASGVTLSGNSLAFVKGPCSKGSQVVVRDLTTGKERAIPPPASGFYSPWSLAGRFLLVTHRPAGASTASFVLIDWATGRALATFAPRPGRELAAGAVQPDGTFALSEHPSQGSGPERCLSRIHVLRPPSYVPAQLAGLICDRGLKLAANTLTFVDRLAPDLGGAVSRISQSDLVGRRRTAASFGRVYALPTFDADRRYLLVSARRCDRRYDLVRLRRGEKTYRPGSASCPARPARSGRLGRNAIRVRVSCPRGCKGLVAFRFRGRRLAIAPIRGTGTLRVRMPLNRTGRLLAARHQSLRGSLRTAVLTRRDLAGAKDGSLYDPVQRVTRRVVVVR